MTLPKLALFCPANYWAKCARSRRKRLARADHSSFRHVNPQSIEGRTDVFRGNQVGLGIVEVDVKVGQHRLARPEPVDVLESFSQAQVAWMRSRTKRVEDPDVQS